MRRFIGSLACFAVVACLSFMSPHKAVAQPGGGGGMGGGMGGGRMMGMQAFNVDAIWSDVTFKINTDDQQVVKIRTALLPLWDQREGIMAKMQGGGADMAAIQKQMATLKTQCDDKLKAILNKDQYAAYTKLGDERKKRMEEQPARFMQRQ